MTVELSGELTASRHPLTMSFVLGMSWPTSEHFRSCRPLRRGLPPEGDIMRQPKGVEAAAAEFG